MRTNSRTILLVLFSPNLLSPVFLTEEKIARVFPNVSKSGLRSLLFRLVRLGLISKQMLGAQTQYCLTIQGRRRCEDLFPALLPKELDMYLLIFVKAPRTDTGFHYLREKCSRVKSVCLTRGVYLFTCGIPIGIKQDVDTLYQNHVLILRIADQDSGFDWNIINHHHTIWDVINHYSSISKQTDQLLHNIKNKYSLNDGDIYLLFTLLNDFLATLDVDSGLVPKSIPENAKPYAILSQFQSIIQI